MKTYFFAIPQRIKLKNYFLVYLNSFRVLLTNTYLINCIQYRKVNFTNFKFILFLYNIFSTAFLHLSIIIKIFFPLHSNHFHCRFRTNRRWEFSRHKVHRFLKTKLLSRPLHNKHFFQTQFGTLPKKERNIARKIP